MDKFTYILGVTLISIGIILLFLGIVTVFKAKTFYRRALISPIIDGASFLIILVGVLLVKGFSYFSLKVLLLIVVNLITTPIVSHSIVRSAWMSGHKEDIEDDEFDS